MNRSEFDVQVAWTRIELITQVGSADDTSVFSLTVLRLGGEIAVANGPGLMAGPLDELVAHAVDSGVDERLVKDNVKSVLVSLDRLAEWHDERSDGPWRRTTCCGLLRLSQARSAVCGDCPAA